MLLETAVGTNQIMSDAHHKYAIEWEPDSPNLYLDDQVYVDANIPALHRRKGTQHCLFTDEPLYFDLNNAVGGAFGGGCPDSEKCMYNQTEKYHEMGFSYFKTHKTKNGHGCVMICYH